MCKKSAEATGLWACRSSLSSDLSNLKIIRTPSPPPAGGGGVSTNCAESSRHVLSYIGPFFGRHFGPKIRVASARGQASLFIQKRSPKGPQNDLKMSSRPSPQALRFET